MIAPIERDFHGIECLPRPNETYTRFHEGHVMQMVPVIKDYSTPPNLHPGTLIAKEVIASLSTALLFPFGLRRPHRKTPRLADQRTIVFVHGYLSNPSCFLPLSLYLRARGHSAYLSYSYSGEQGVEQAAIGLKSFLRRHVRGGEIDLVCHSLGGLVARVYLQELGGSRRVRSIVTLGTPHRGTTTPTGCGLGLDESCGLTPYF